MDMTKNRTNPINIAPFVDILLVLFVILVVAAKFDGNNEIKTYISTIKKLEQKVKDQKVKLDNASTNQKDTGDSKLLKQLQQAREKIAKLQNKYSTLKSDFDSKIAFERDRYLTLEKKYSSLDKQFLRLQQEQIDNQKQKSKATYTDEDIAKLKNKIAELKKTIKTVTDNLRSIKKDPDRKNDLQIYIDWGGEIWLVDGIYQQTTVKISLSTYQAIIDSLTYANVRYFYEATKQAADTIKKPNLH